MSFENDRAGEGAKRSLADDPSSTANAAPGCACERAREAEPGEPRHDCACEAFARIGDEGFPPAPPMEEVAPRIWRVQVPLPDNPLRALNSYFILDSERTLIIDVGFNHPACQDALTGALRALGRCWDSVEILLTHSHSDHTGCLDRILTPDMRVFANMHSFQEVTNRVSLEAAVFGPILDRVLNLDAGTCPVSPELPDGRRSLERIKVSSELLPMRRRRSFTYLREGDMVSAGGYSFEVISAPGHDSWHICLYDRSERLLIAGDAVLERITPVIMSWLSPHDALGEFIASLTKLRALEVDTILAGHGAPFGGLQERVDFLLAHHTERLEEIYQLVRAGKTDLIDITSSCTWKHPDWHSWEVNQKYFSLGETMAHLIHLVHIERLEQVCFGREVSFRFPAQRTIG